MSYYHKSIGDVLDEFEVSPEEGLGSGEVSERTTKYGLNALAKEKTETILGLFIKQFKSPLIYILLAASVLVFFTGDFLDASVILAVIVTNSIVGTFQEGKAKNSLARLRSLIHHRALVRRSGEEILISAEEVVPGDILIIKEGDRISADARVIKEEAFKVDESILTGEAYAVEKTSEVVSGDDLVVGDMVNMVFSGTSAVGGYCEAVVVATGAQSELGKISAEIVETSDVPLPLEKKITKLVHFISLFTFGISALVFLVGILRGIGFSEIFGVAVGMVVSLIPEGLPVAVTIVLARGVFRMAKAKAIVSQMAAVEAMGNADTLLVDKTGTITTGKMVIRKVFSKGVEYQISGEGYEPKGKIVDLKSGKEGAGDDLKNILGLVFLSLKAEPIHDEGGGWKPSGDPTEVAISVLCRKAGLLREKLEGQYKVVFTKPFDLEKRYIEASFAKGGKTHHVFVGAPDFLSKKLKVDHGFLQKYHSLAGEGLRVVGAAVFDGKVVSDWVLLAIDEEIRHSVLHSIADAKDAGFKICMLTGDYPETAKEIAKKVGIWGDGDGILTGVEVEKLSSEELSRKVVKVSVFARITPEHKLKIVKAFQRAGAVCAMTGDGVNDAPALQAANLGIALGSGTQVAKDSADIVLTNNDFKTIVDAIFEGRAIYFSLKKVILYLFSTSLGELLVIAGSIMIGLPLPVVAVQIIWLNFVTDGFFVVALAQDNPIDRRPPAMKNVGADNLVDRLMIRRILLMGFAMFISALPIFYFFNILFPVEYARTMALVILSVSQWFNAFNVRSRSRSVFTTGISLWLIWAIVSVFVLQYIAVETSVGNKLLHTVNLDTRHWILAFLASTLVIWVEEARKIASRLSGDKKKSP